MNLHINNEMIDKILIFICGVGLIYLGIEVIRTGELFIKGIFVDYADFNIPVGIIFILFGMFLIYFSLIKKKSNNT